MTEYSFNSLMADKKLGNVQTLVDGAERNLREDDNCFEPSDIFYVS